MLDLDDDLTARQSALAQRASAWDVRRILAAKPQPMDGSPLGGMLDSMRLGLGGNLQGDRDAQLWRRSIGADAYHVRAALHALLDKALAKASRFDRLAFELSTAAKECRPKERCCRASELRPLRVLLGDESGPCLARTLKGLPCKAARMHGEPYCQTHMAAVDRGELPAPRPVALVTDAGDEYQRDATLQDLQPIPKPGHRWEPDRDAWMLGRGRWVPEVEADEVNQAALEAWEERAATPAEGYAVVISYVPVHYRQGEVAELLEGIATVNEVRANRHRPRLDPLPEPEGSMTVAAYRERAGVAHADAAGVYVRPWDVRRGIDRYCDLARGSEAFRELFAMSGHGRLRSR